MDRLIGRIYFFFGLIAIAVGGYTLTLVLRHDPTITHAWIASILAVWIIAVGIVLCWVCRRIM